MQIQSELELDSKSEDLNLVSLTELLSMTRYTPPGVVISTVDEAKPSKPSMAVIKNLKSEKSYDYWKQCSKAKIGAAIENNDFNEYKFFLGPAVGSLIYEYENRIFNELDQLYFDEFCKEVMYEIASDVVNKALGSVNDLSGMAIKIKQQLDACIIEKMKKNWNIEFTDLIIAHIEMLEQNFLFNIYSHTSGESLKKFLNAFRYPQKKS